MRKALRADQVRADGIDLADYDAVVAAIYEAVLHPSQWEIALTGLMSRFGQDRWDISMLLWERVTRPAGRFIASSGVHAMARHGYANHFAGNNDWSRRGHHMPVGSVFHSDELVDRTAFRRTPFFRDYLAGFDLEVGVIALLDRQGGDHLCLCMPGPDNGAPNRLTTALKLLVPHMQRAVRISRRLGEAELSARSATAALEAAPSAILMCDRHLRLTFANGHGAMLLHAGYLTAIQDRLALPDRRQTERLRQLARTSGGSRCAAFTLTAAGRPPLAAMALAMDEEPGSPLNPDFGAVRVMIVAGVNHRTSFANVDFLKDWFALTPTEARLAATLGEGGSLEDFAAMRGVTIHAARFLLRGIYAKTDTNRMPNLVAKLHATPLQWHIGERNSDLPSPIGD